MELHQGGCWERFLTKPLSSALRQLAEGSKSQVTYRGPNKKKKKDMCPIISFVGRMLNRDVCVVLVNSYATAEQGQFVVLKARCFHNISGFY